MRRGVGQLILSVANRARGANNCGARAPHTAGVVSILRVALALRWAGKRRASAGGGHVGVWAGLGDCLAASLWLLVPSAVHNGYGARWNRRHRPRKKSSVHL